MNNNRRKIWLESGEEKQNAFIQWPNDSCCNLSLQFLNTTRTSASIRSCSFCCRIASIWQSLRCVSEDMCDTFPVYDEARLPQQCVDDGNGCVTCVHIFFSFSPISYPLGLHANSAGWITPQIHTNKQTNKRTQINRLSLNKFRMLLSFPQRIPSQCSCTPPWHCSSCLTLLYSTLLSIS